MEYTQEEISKGKGMAVLSYIGFLALIPFFAEKENKYVVYHAKQGMNLFLIEIAYAVVAAILRSVIRTPVSFYGINVGYTTPGWLNAILTLASLAISALSIVGIVYACQGKAKELPVVGQVKIIK